MITAQQKIMVLWFYPDHSKCLGNTVESRFLEPSFFELPDHSNQKPFASPLQFYSRFLKLSDFSTKFLFHLEVRKVGIIVWFTAFDLQFVSHRK